MFGAMTLAQYRKDQKLSQAKFAERLSLAGYPTTQALVSQWESGSVEITAERCVQIEKVTDGAVRRVDLRPDLFGPLDEGEAA